MGTVGSAALELTELSGPVDEEVLYGILEQQRMSLKLGHRYLKLILNEDVRTFVKVDATNRVSEHATVDIYGITQKFDGIVYEPKSKNLFMQIYVQVDCEVQSGPGHRSTSFDYTYSLAYNAKTDTVKHEHKPAVEAKLRDPDTINVLKLLQLSGDLK